MDFYKTEMMDRDCFWMLHLFSIDLYSLTITRFVLTYAILIQLAIYVFEISIFTIHPKYFMKYAPFLFSRAYGTAAGLAILWKQKQLENLWKDFELWSINSVGEVFHNKVKKPIQNVNVFAIATLITCILLAIVFVLPNAADFDYNLIMYLLKKWFPEFSPVLVVFLKLSFLPVFSSMLVHPFLLIYIAQHARLQGFMLIEKLKTISTGFDGKIEELVEDKNFQVEMHQRLSYLIAKHLNIINFSRKMLNEVVKPLFVILIGMGFVLGLSIILMTYERNLGAYQNTWNSAVLLVLFSVITTVVFSLTIISGQAVENACEDLLLEVVTMDWYIFNKSNRLTTMILMMNALKPIRIHFTWNLAINYDLGVRMARGFYSIISLLMSTNMKHFK